jgi:hypothetical protein
MSYKILGSSWHTPPTNGVILAPGIGYNNNLCIGVVAIESGPPQKDGTLNWKAYIGYGVTGEQAPDEQRIAANGSKLIKDVAIAYFPELPIEGFKY